jgi:hypothetical protein
MARGAFEIDLEWENGDWTRAEILSRKGLSCVIKSKGGISVTQGEKKIRINKKSKDIYSFKTSPGQKYSLVNKALQKNALTNDSRRFKTDYSSYSNINDLIRNRIYNVDVVGTQITTKLATTINAGKEVLLVVDGGIVNSISHINPSDVKSIRYVHNNEASKYGVRGTNGAIEIILK